MPGGDGGVPLMPPGAHKRPVMTLWWLQPGWTQARCACGAQIYPEGDPDWGRCFQCFTEEMEQARQYEEMEDRRYEAFSHQYDDLGPIIDQQ